MNIAIEVPCLWDVHGALAGGAIPGAGAASGVAVEAPLAARALLSLRIVQACLQDEREKEISHFTFSNSTIILILILPFGWEIGILVEQSN